MENMQTFIIGLVVVSVTLVIGIYIISTIEGTLPAGSSAANAAGDITVSLAQGTPWITILVNTIALSSSNRLEHNPEYRLTSSRGQDRSVKVYYTNARTTDKGFSITYEKDIQSELIQ